MDALTTLASFKSQANVVKNVVKAGCPFYQASTIDEVEDDQSFVEALVFQQVTTCDSTPKSLQEAISSNNDSSEGREDTEAVEMITIKENISEM